MRNNDTSNRGHAAAASRNFDSLPDSANVRIPVVQELFGCGRSSVWAWTKDGRLPAPRKLSSRCTVWNVGELRQALQQK